MWSLKFRGETLQCRLLPPFADWHRSSHCSSAAHSIARRIPDAALGKVFLKPFCWAERTKEDTPCSSWEGFLIAVVPGKALQEGCRQSIARRLLGRSFHSNSAGQSVARRMLGAAFEKTFSLHVCWAERCKEDTRRSSWEGLLIAVLLGRALQGVKAHVRVAGRLLPSCILFLV